MKATIVFSCLLAMLSIVVASIASLRRSASRRAHRGTAGPGRAADDATAIAAILAASTASSAGGSSCDAGSSGACH